MTTPEHTHINQQADEIERLRAENARLREEMGEAKMMHVHPNATNYTPDEKRTIYLPFYMAQEEEIEAVGLFSVYSVERATGVPHSNSAVVYAAYLNGIERTDSQGRTWYIMRERLPALLGCTVAELTEAVKDVEEAVADMWEDAA